MSGASSSNWPGAGLGACQHSKGTNSGTDHKRNCHGRRMASKPPPNKTSTPAHNGAAGKNTTAQGQLASHCSPAARGCKAHAASDHNGAHTTPASARGVTTSVTHGMASKLAANPTSDTWPNSSRLSGVSASVTTHCSRNNA